MPEPTVQDWQRLEAEVRSLEKQHAEAVGRLKQLSAKTLKDQEADVARRRKELKELEAECATKLSEFWAEHRRRMVGD